MIKQSWTAQDNMELKALSAKLFGNDTFKIFSKEEENTIEYKRYSELVNRKQKALAKVFGK